MASLQLLSSCKVFVIWHHHCTIS